MALVVAVLARIRGFIMDTQQQPAAEASSLSGYMPLSEWVSQHAGPFFGSRASVDWFVKRNRPALIEAEALIPGRGRAGSIVHAEKFSQQVIAIRKREALARTAA